MMYNEVCGYYGCTMVHIDLLFEKEEEWETGISSNFERAKEINSQKDDGK
jgi:hypothetical protein